MKPIVYSTWDSKLGTASTFIYITMWCDVYIMTLLTLMLLVKYMLFELFY